MPKESFFLNKQVERSCESNRDHTLHIIFETLLLEKKAKQQDLADYLGLDKAYISRMVWGKLFPVLRVRLKVAEFFGVDTSLIWREG